MYLVKSFKNYDCSGMAGLWTVFMDIIVVIIFHYTKVEIFEWPSTSREWILIILIAIIDVVYAVASVTLNKKTENLLESFCYFCLF